MDPRYNQAEKSVLMQPQPHPPVYQDNPAAYPPSYPGQPVPQASFAPGTYPGQAVVTVQPTVLVTAAPLPDYLCYSIFTMICCCLPLGIAALFFSISTRNANFSGQRALAEKNSKTARTLNHVGLGLGIAFFVLIITINVVVVLIAPQTLNKYP